MLRGRSSRLWTPKDNLDGVVVWFDFTDPTTITLTSGYVSQALDKGPFGCHAVQSSSGNRPGYHAPTSLSDDGYLDMTANGGATYLETPNLTAAMNIFGSKPKAMFAVVTPSGSIGYNGYCGSGPISATGDSFYFITNTYDPYFLGNGADVNSSQAYASGTKEILSLVSTPGLQVLGKNGNTQSQTWTSSATLNMAADGFWIGTGNGSLGVAPCHIHEIILLAGDLWNTNLYQKYEGYLANKHGSLGLLPSTHPYKLQPPMVTL